MDVNSFRVQGIFQETSIRNPHAGSRAIVTLMASPGAPIEGRVDSLDWKIARKDGRTAYELLSKITLLFEWNRLTQRVPAACRRTGVDIFSIWTLYPAA
jgi:multidrug resistance efflux pump